MDTSHKLLDLLACLTPSFPFIISKVLILHNIHIHFPLILNAFGLFFSGRKAYLSYLDKIYKQNDVSWFTPVELFKPWYAHAIAEAILRTTNLSFPLKVSHFILYLFFFIYNDNNHNYLYVL